MKYILGTKQSMTQYFAEDGKAHAATLVSAGPMTVTQIKNIEKDGYAALQVGYGARRAKNITKPMAGHFGENGTFAFVREFPMTEGEHRPRHLQGRRQGDRQRHLEGKGLPGCHQAPQLQRRTSHARSEAL